MIKHVLIDPYMFTISDLEDVKNNIVFFQNIITLSSEKIIKVYMDSECQTKLMTFNYCPFQINDELLNSDRRLKIEVTLLRNLFMKFLSSIVILDPGICCNYEVCCGNLQLIPNFDYYKYDQYFSIFHLILLVCCDKEKELDNYFLIGNHYKLFNMNDSIKLICSCKIKSFEKEITWVSDSIFIDDKVKIINLIKKYRKSSPIEYIEKPEVVRNDHHCPYQANQPINYFSDIRWKNKQLLVELRKLNLIKVHLLDYRCSSKYLVGEILLKEIHNYNITCTIQFDDGYMVNAVLYFPSELSTILYEYFKLFDNLVTKKSINYLLSELSLI